MIQAILMERIGFVDLLLTNGFIMKNFLTVEKLANLYNEQVQKQISNVPFSPLSVSFHSTYLAFFSRFDAMLLLVK